MAVKYEVSPMNVGFGEEKKEAYVARIQLDDTVSTDQLIEQVALRTQQQPAAIRIALENLVDSIFHYAEMGKGVRVGELGIIKPAITSRAAKTADEVEIVKSKYLFIPSVKMKAALNKLTIRKVNDAPASGGGSTPGGGGGSTPGGGGGVEMT